MALTATQIETKIEELQLAIGSGALRVKHGDTEVMYQDIAAMLRALSYLQGLLAEVSDATRIRAVRFKTDKGFNS